MIITELQKKEIEALQEHKDALIAYGADMHLQGIIKGFAILGVTELVVSGIIILFRKRKEKENRA